MHVGRHTHTHRQVSRLAGKQTYTDIDSHTGRKSCRQTLMKTDSNLVRPALI